MDGPGQALTDTLRHTATQKLGRGCEFATGVSRYAVVNAMGAVFVAVQASYCDLISFIRPKDQSSLRLGDAEASQYADKGRKDR